MRRLILTLPMLLAACESKVEYVTVSPVVPADLLRPVPISERRAETYRDLAILATEHLNSARQANAKIEALGQILGPQ
ncbi:MAG: Rz1-like lysis system protein LysC [Paracoccaceae bacterium]